MICLQRQEGWEVTFQRAHALMAAQILAHWQPEDRPVFWVELLAACAQHDNGWTEWEPGGRLSKAGAPMDFRHMPLEQNLVQAERVVKLGWHQDQVVGWLISRHMHQIYDPRRQELAAFDQWLKKEERRRQKATRDLGHEGEALERAYAMLYWCDTLSLVLCEEQVPFGGRRMEVASGPDGREYQVWEDEGGEGGVNVWPWPLEAEALDVSVESYLVKKLSFVDHDAFLETLEGLVPLRRTFCLRPGSVVPAFEMSLLGKTLQELQELARHHGVAGRSGMNKQELVGALLKHGG